MNEQHYLSRVDFQHRLEPAGNSILHGVGQSPYDFEQYFQSIGECKPGISMTYVSLKDDLPSYFQTLRENLERYRPYYVIPQIGLYMNRGGLNEHDGGPYDGQVAAGAFDEQIECFCEGLALLRRPAFVRIGFEFNGPWNGYQSETFKEAWTRIALAIRRNGLEQVALVWCYCPLPGSREPERGIDRDYLPYYPGDELVDWWSIDLFEQKHFTQDNTLAFLRDAEQARFPVMIGESTPRGIGVTDEQAWEKWFVPYFTFIRQHPVVKAFCYINMNWTPFEPFKDWGDARLQSNPLVKDRYQQEIARSIYTHAPLENS